MSAAPNVTAEPISLYVHLPWCVQKCPYCDFNSFALRGELPETDYVAALLRDLDFERAAIDGRAVASIYLGGGTPSLFSPAACAALLSGVRERVDIAANAEITLEANPGTLEAGRFAGFRTAGVNRVSIGVQSLRDARLVALGRVHSAAEARNAVAAAMRAGFNSVNLDLMYGLPGDGVDEGLQDLSAAIELGTPHLSWYQLTLEPHTAWERSPPADIPDDDINVELEARGRDLLRSAGYSRYEISAYAKPGHRCRHNLQYWRFGDYVGIGAGAHSKLRATAGPGHTRRSKRRNPLSYMQSAGQAACIETSEEISGCRAVTLEYLMNSLRLTGGTLADEFEQVCGIDGDALRVVRNSAVTAGLMESDSQRLCATKSGLAQLNAILRMV